MASQFHCFKCSPKDVDKTDLSNGEYLKCNEPKSVKELLYNEANVYMFYGRKYYESVWLNDLKQLFFLARKGIRQLEQAAYKTESSSQLFNFSEIRKNICALWLAARNTIVNYKQKKEYVEIVQNISKELKYIVEESPRLKDLPDYVLFHSLKCFEQPVSHPSQEFVHLLLDLRWITLTVNYIEDDAVLDQQEELEKSFNILFEDLVYVAVKKFDLNYGDVNTSPFICSCFKELWLLMQLLIEELNVQHICKDFWNYYFKRVYQIISIENSVDGKEPVCCLWLLYNVAKLQGYDASGNYIGPTNRRVMSNFELVSLCLKSVLQANTDEKCMRICLQLIAHLQVEWWTKDATFDILQLLWEHFYKRLHTSFAVSTDSSFFAHTQKLCNFEQFLESILKCDVHSSNSYELFLYLLSFFLKRNPSYWAKLKGRIYSKLSTSKLATFTNVGLQNLVLLMLTLAHSVNFTELTEKLVNLLNQLPSKNTEENAVVWSAYISLIILYIKRNMSIKIISTPLICLVEQASVNRSRVMFMRLFIDGLAVIVDNLGTFQCNEHVLFVSKWLDCYLQWCPYNEACSLLQLLVQLIDKLKLAGIDNEWWNTLDTRIVPPILRLSTGADSPHQVAEVAAALVSADSERYTNIVEQLTADGVNTELVEKFLRTLLERADVHQILKHQTIIIQAWIRISMLNINQHSLFDITQLVCRLPLWTESLGYLNVPDNEDPLYVVIKLAGKKTREAQTMTEIATMKRWFETYFGSMDKWAVFAMNSVDKTENNRLLLRIYTCGALLFIHCISALYTKNKTTSLLHRLVSAMLLPSTVLMNKKPPDGMLAALKVTWHLYVRGIVRLDYRTDIYIERILKDIVIRYVSYFNDSSSPIIRCLDTEFKDEDTVFIIDKISSLITYKSKTDTEYVTQALNLISEMVTAKTSDEKKITILIEKVGPSLLEQIMFIENRSNKQNVIQIFQRLKNLFHYANIREAVKSSILSVIDKHLPFYSCSVFQMLETLLKIMKTEIQEIITNLKEAIQKVERMRGVGYDNTLRKGLQDIQDMLNR